MGKRINYHSHTVRCLHASSTEEEFIQHALAADYSVWGFTDHCPWNYTDGYVSNMRMTAAQYPDYLATVRALAQKYSADIRVLCGLEVEYFPDMMDWMIDLKHSTGLDYLILGNHFDSTERGGLYFGRCDTLAKVQRYVYMVTTAMQTGEFAYFAHPDLCFRAFTPDQFDANMRAAARDICQCAKELDFPLEYNLLGVRYRNEGREKGMGYPCLPFWEVVAEEGAKGIIGLDAHHLIHIDDTSLYDEAVALLERLGVQRVEDIGV